MRKITFEIIDCGKTFRAIKRIEWPDANPAINRPLPVFLGEFGDMEGARRACNDEASRESLVAAETGDRVVWLDE